MRDSREKDNTVAARGYIRVGMAIAVTLAMGLGSGMAGSTAYAQGTDKGTTSSSVQQTDSTITNGMPVVITELAVKTSNVNVPDATGAMQPVNAGNSSN